MPVRDLPERRFGHRSQVLPRLRLLQSPESESLKRHRHPLCGHALPDHFNRRGVLQLSSGQSLSISSLSCTLKLKFDTWRRLSSTARVSTNPLLDRYRGYRTGIFGRIYMADVGQLERSSGWKSGVLPLRHASGVSLSSTAVYCSSGILYPVYPNGVLPHVPYSRIPTEILKSVIANLIIYDL